jgi:hypothetical protein
MFKSCRPDMILQKDAKIYYLSVFLRFHSECAWAYGKLYCKSALFSETFEFRNTILMAINSAVETLLFIWVFRNLSTIFWMGAGEAVQFGNRVHSFRGMSRIRSTDASCLHRFEYKGRLGSPGGSAHVSKALSRNFLENVQLLPTSLKEISVCPQCVHYAE